MGQLAKLGPRLALSTPAAHRLKSMDRKRLRLLLLGGAGLVVAGLLAIAITYLEIGSNGPTDRTTAELLALDYYGQHHPPADILSDVNVTAETQTGRMVWQFRIEGQVTEPGSTVAYLSTMILEVDLSSRAVTVLGSG